MNIFLTVGSQLPMDRLVGAVENIIADRDDIDCIAQVGDSGLHLKKIKAYPVLPEPKFINYAIAADVIISHAGMGNILLADELKKPIIVLARKSGFNESVNDHQLGTLKGLSERHFIFPMTSENDLERGFDWFKTWKPNNNIPERAELINSLRHYILT